MLPYKLVLIVAPGCMYKVGHEHRFSTKLQNNRVKVVWLLAAEIDIRYNSSMGKKISLTRVHIAGKIKCAYMEN